MQWTGAVVVLGLVATMAQGGPGQGGDCREQCARVYSLHTTQYDQVRPSLDACQIGCDSFSRIEGSYGFQDTLTNLQNCNYSCEEQFEGPPLPACQSGCGFHFDSDVSAQRSPAPGPPFPRARGPAFPRSQAPPRPTFRAETPRAWPAETPRTTMMRSDNPLLNMIRSPGPVMMRGPGPVMIRQSDGPQRVTPMMGFPAPPQPPMVTKENPRGPTIIGFSLPQLLSRVIPRIEQALPRMDQMPSMEAFFSRMEQQQPRRNLPTLELSLPSMDQIFSRIEEDMPDLEPLMEQRMEPLLNRVMEIEIENPFEEFEEAPRLSMPRIPKGFFGQKDHDREPFGFSGLFNHMSRMMSSIPSQFGGVMNWPPIGPPHEMGRLTVIKAGPGFHEEQHFNIGPNGELVEITETPIQRDALEHENPMDVHFNSNDVEVFHANDSDDADAEIFEFTTEPPKTEEKTEETREPVMSVWEVETNEVPKALPKVESVEFSAKEYPFLSVLRNTVAENERISQQLLKRYRSLADKEYRDDYTCNSDHLKWSDWVACLHARVGVPRWLTAATISLGIVFSVWLCLVIPSAAPKQRIRALVIKAEKPSATLAKAKEAEAAAKAAGVDPSMVVAVVKVDLPPSYGDVRPASPAPSYKSDMVPASPAPSYRSVDIPAKKESKEEKVVLEPVHGAEAKGEKESLA